MRAIRSQIVIARKFRLAIERLGTTPFLMFFIAFVVAATILCWPYLFGDRAFAFVDIGSDSFVQFYPLQVVAADGLRDGTLFSNSFRIGLGAYPAATHDLGFILAAFFPPDWQLDLRIYKYLFILFLGGSGFYFYLRALGLSPRIAAVGAFAYAFSGYGLINAQWDPHGIEYAVLPFLLVGIEKSLQRQQPIYGVALGLLTAMEHTFSIFSNIVLFAAYAVVRWYVSGYRQGILHYLSLLVRTGFGYVLGLALLAPIVAPKLWYLFDSPRVSESSVFSLSMLLGKIFALNSLDLIAQQLLGFLHKDVFGVADQFKGWVNYFEAPGFYVGIWALIVLPQLWTAKRIRLERRLLLVSLVLVIGYVVLPAIRHSVFLFGHPAFRTSTLWLSTLVLVAALFAMRRVGRTGVSVALLSTTLGLLVIGLAMAAWRYRETIINDALIKVAIFAALYTSLLFATKRSRRPAIWSAIAVTIFIEALSFSYPALRLRDAVSRSGEGKGLTYSDPTLPALHHIALEQGSAAFYRIARDYSSAFLCDALIQRYRGIKSYYFNGSSYTRFSSAFEAPRPAPSVSYAADPLGRLDALRLVGARYLLSGSPQTWGGNPALSLIAQFDHIFLYRLTQAPIYLFDRIVTINKEEKAPPIGSLDSALYALPTEAAQLQRQLPSPRTDTWSRRTVELSSPRDDIVLARTDSDRAAALLLPLPFDPGWRIRVDDRPVTAVEADFGLTAVTLSAGTHRVEARFLAPWLVLGYWIAAGAAAGVLSLLRSKPKMIQESCSTV